MTLDEELIDVAKALLVGAPSLASRRRAISTAYYAVFHALAVLCTEELLAMELDMRSPEYSRVYRALDHGSLKSAFNGTPLNDLPEIKAVGNRIVALQSARIRADYEPILADTPTVRECENFIGSAEDATAALEKLSTEHRRTLAVHLIFKMRAR